MSRVQLALNVADLTQAVEFYSKLFGAEPAKLRPGYANFAISEPPLKLVLIEDATMEPGSINHLGVELATSHDVQVAKERLEHSGLPCSTENEVECCHALQDKVWAYGPRGEAWEFYTVLADVDAEGALRSGGTSGAPCCASRPDLAGAGAKSSCC